jgi:hypothetical protein
MGDRPVARLLPTHDSRTQKNADIHPCPERDSNPRSLHASEMQPPPEDVMFFNNPASLNRKTVLILFNQIFFDIWIRHLYFLVKLGNTDTWRGPKRFWLNKFFFFFFFFFFLFFPYPFFRRRNFFLLMDPLDIWWDSLGGGSVQRQGLSYTGQRNTEKHRHTSMSRAGFETAIPMFKRPTTVLTLDSAAIDTGYLIISSEYFWVVSSLGEKSLLPFRGYAHFQLEGYVK